MKNFVLIPLVVGAALAMLVFAGLFGASLAEFEESAETAQGTVGPLNGVAQVQDGSGAVSGDGEMMAPVDVLARAEAMAAALPRPNGVPDGMMPPDPAYAGDVEEGVRQVDNSVRKLPGLVAHVAGQLGKHGLAGLVYEDPELKRLGRETGKELGSGIRHLMDAVGKDMVASAQPHR